MSTNNKKRLMHWQWLLPLLLLASGPGMAASIEKLLMPGKVIEGHAKYEAKCENCHETFNKDGQNLLCRDCHDKVDEDIKAKRGYHGKTDATECNACHSDHLGRDADIVHLDREVFDHAKTDYPLKGAHARVKCDSCHEEDKKFRDAPSDCISCHKEDDRHRGKLGKKCADCHEVTGWKKNSFDHDKTEFALKGKHTEVSCQSCHPNEKYKDVPKDCASCHRINDVHAGRYGAKCETCHSVKDWDRISFDHDKTDYPLRDRHRDVPCDQCHTGDLYKQDLPTDCYGCHKLHDEHRGKNGKKCKDCHSTKSWKKAQFDHTKDTEFPLRGAHEKVSCESCHRGDVYKQKTDKACVSCHRNDDVHNGEQGRECQTCHKETNWGENVKFDHDLTRFPLLGLHATTPCEECHLSAEYKGAPLACVECHEDSDEHKGRLGPKCAACHNPNSWKLWAFDHDTQTDFKLEGKHKGLECLACHTRAGDNVAVDTGCGSCHQSDDVHLGRFGRQCDRCHNSESFRELDFPR